MKTTLAFALTACFGFTGCYTQLYTQGYATRAVEGEYAQSPRDAADTALAGDSSQAAQAREGDTLYRPGAVVVNNYYQDRPYYRGYLVDEWEYPSISFGFYSSRYRDYNGAYWWSDPGYRRGYDRGGYGRRDGGSYPSAGGGTAGPYKSDKRIFSTAPDRPAKGHRSTSGSTYIPPPAPKAASEGSSNSGSSSSGSSASAPSSGGDSSSGSKSGSASSGSSDKEDHPALNKGRRR
ncbi:MAG: hypothetical protein JWO30_607 [Fibrobacteres bacterium]|nr:hypothetical protein [Fibrobacterota bacterium]